MTSNTQDKACGIPHRRNTHLIPVQRWDCVFDKSRTPISEKK